MPNSPTPALFERIRQYLPVKHQRRAEDEDTRPEPRVLTAGVWFCAGAAVALIAQAYLPSPQPTEPVPTVALDVADYHFRIASEYSQWCATEQPR